MFSVTPASSVNVETASEALCRQIKPPHVKIAKVIFTPTRPSSSLRSLTYYCIELHCNQFNDVMILNALRSSRVDRISEDVLNN